MKISFRASRLIIILVYTCVISFSYILWSAYVQTYVRLSSLSWYFRDCIRSLLICQCIRCPTNEQQINFYAFRVLSGPFPSFFFCVYLFTWIIHFYPCETKPYFYLIYFLSSLVLPDLLKSVPFRKCHTHTHRREQ